jgi:hypothetical protein
MLASRGDSGPPCGVPSSLAVTIPSSMAPRRRNFPIKCSTLLSRITRATRPEPVAMLAERRIEDRCQRLQQQLLNEPVLYRWDHPSLHRRYSGFFATTASEDFSPTLAGEISPGKVRNLSSRAVRPAALRDKSRGQGPSVTPSPAGSRRCAAATARWCSWAGVRAAAR